jgi:WhiB family redox-sensing transcriptional regulator
VTAPAPAVPDWRNDAACRRTDPVIFFPSPGQSPDPAKRVCTACPVRAQCLDFALSAGFRYGVWAGTTERERRPLLAERRRLTQGAA